MSSARDLLRRRLDTVESSYEYLLAYAAQGLPSDQVARDRGKVRSELEALAAALDGLAAAFEALAPEASGAGREEHLGFLRVLGEDAARALAAVRLVLAQRAISSQLVDNLNASVHLRAVLTGVFLLDEILGVLGSEAPAARAAEPPA